MKLFEFHGAPSETEEDVLEFSLIPTNDLTNQVNKTWLTQLTEEVTSCVTSILENNDKRKDAKMTMGLIKVQAKLEENGGILIETVPMGLLNQIIADLDDETFEKVDKLTDICGDKVGEILGQYTVELMNVVNGVK